MSNIVWMSDVRNTLTIDGVEYIFSGIVGYMKMSGAASVSGFAAVRTSTLWGNAQVSGRAKVTLAEVCDDVVVTGTANVKMGSNLPLDFVC